MVSDFRVAAVVATYNHERYAAEAVSSLIDQVDQVIVVDDASTDGTWDVLQSMPRGNLRLLRNKTQLGVSASYNRGVTAASAEVILIQGGDDRSFACRAEQQAAALLDPNVSLAFSLPTVIDSSGRLLPRSLASEFLVGATDPEPLNELFFGANYICAPSVAVRAADYLECGGFRPGLDLLQDFDLWLTLAARGRFLRISEPVVEYRKHDANLSREYTALDARKQRRLAAERDHILRRFIDTTDVGTLIRLASVCGLDLDLFATLDRRWQAALIQLSHPDKLVVRRGLDALFDWVAENSDSELTLLGLGREDLARFSTIADVENLEDVNRALTAARAAN